MEPLEPGASEPRTGMNAWPPWWHYERRLQPCRWHFAPNRSSIIALRGAAEVVFAAKASYTSKKGGVRRSRDILRTAGTRWPRPQ
jgi:hypothetical protein